MLMLSNLKRTLGIKFASKMCLRLLFVIMVILMIPYITFESALATVVECSLSYDYDYVETERCLSKKGRRCRKYVISVDNGD